jgi:electron-transferring-flavoprotein dehydrogenase
VYIGFVVGLDYVDPRLAPFEAFQQFKHHPSVKPLLNGGEILAAGARTIAAGGWQSLPTLEMPGALLIGDAGGTLNVPKIKGIHQAVRSGVCAAEQLVETGGPAGFDARWRASAGGRELYQVRNIKPAFKRGFWWGFANGAWETLTAGHSPWTLANPTSDAARLKQLDAYVSPDRHWVTRTLPPRDRVSSVFFAGNTHEESQPAHLKVADTSICATRCERVRQSVRTLLSRERLRDGGRWRGRPDAAHQRRQLRALQGLRYQGSVRNHYLDYAGRWVGAELSESLRGRWHAQAWTRD